MTKFILGFSQEQKNCLITSSVSRRSLGQLDISQYNTQKGRKKKKPDNSICTFLRNLLT